MGLHRPPSQEALPILQEAVRRLDDFLLSIPLPRREALRVAWDMRNVHRALSRYAQRLSQPGGARPLASSWGQDALAQPLTPPLDGGYGRARFGYCITSSA